LNHTEQQRKRTQKDTKRRMRKISEKLTGSFLKKTNDVRVSINHRFFQDFQPIPTVYQNRITLINSKIIDLFRNNKCKTTENRGIRYFPLVVSNIRLVVTYLLVISVSELGNVRCLGKVIFPKNKKGCFEGIYCHFV